MAKDSSDVFILAVLILSLHNGFGFAFNIDITPNKVNGLVHNDVLISCTLEKSDTGVREVVLMEVSKDNAPIAILRQKSAATIEKGMESKFTAEGNISTSVYESNLRLTLSGTNMDDSGAYDCQMYYLDELHVLKDSKKSANLTVSDDDTKSAMKYLSNKVFSLETQLEIQSSKNDELQDQIYKLNDTESFTTAFSVEHPTKADFQLNNTILFTRFILDVGGHYDKDTGVFTAPRKGLYVFHMLMTTEKKSYETHVDLKVNDKIVATMFSYDNHNWSAGTISTVTSLNSGDQVKPVTRSTTYLKINEQYTIFNGYLLKLL